MLVIVTDTKSYDVNVTKCLEVQDLGINAVFLARGNVTTRPR